MKRSIILLSMFSLAASAMAQQKPDYQQTRTPQVLSNYSGRFTKSLGIPSGPAPGFPAWVSDTSKNGSLWNKTTTGQPDTLKMYDSNCGCWKPISAKIPSFGNNSSVMRPAFVNSSHELTEFNGMTWLGSPFNLMTFSNNVQVNGNLYAGGSNVRMTSLPFMAARDTVYNVTISKNGKSLGVDTTSHLNVAGGNQYYGHQTLNGGMQFIGTGYSEMDGGRWQNINSFNYFGIGGTDPLVVSGSQAYTFKPDSITRASDGARVVFKTDLGSYYTRTLADTSFIQNQNSSAQNLNFWINGTGKINGSGTDYTSFNGSSITLSTSSGGNIAVGDPVTHKYTAQTGPGLEVHGSSLTPSDDYAKYGNNDILFARLNGSAYSQTLSASTALTANSLITLPAGSGTIALTSDIAALATNDFTTTQSIISAQGANAGKLYTNILTLGNATSTDWARFAAVGGGIDQSTFGASQNFYVSQNKLTLQLVDVATQGFYSNIDHLNIKGYGFVGNAPVSPNGIVRKRDVDSLLTTGNYLPKTGGTMTGDIILSSATPTDPLAPVPLTMFQNALTGITWKNAVRLKTTANITLSGTQTIDGVAAVAGNRILVNSQTNQTQNGIYIVAAGAWSRATDADAGDEILTSTVAVTLGTSNKNTQWTCLNITEPTVGTDNINYGQISGAGTYTGSAGVTLTGNVFTADLSYLNSYYPQMAGSYANPAWITSLPWSKITGSPTTITGYGITDAYTKTQSDANYIRTSPAASQSITASLPGTGLLAFRNTSATGFTSLDFLNESGALSMAMGHGNSSTSNTSNVNYFLSGDNSPYVFYQKPASANVEVFRINSTLISTPNTLAISKDAIAATSTDAIVVQNTTAATSGVPIQYSGRMRFSGAAWNTTATAASNSIDFINQLKPSTGATTGGNLTWGYQNNGGGYSDIMTLDQTGLLKLATGYANATSTNNSSLSLNTTGSVISRNVNDANATLTVNNLLGTGNIFNAQFNGSNKFTVDFSGNLYGAQRLSLGTTTVASNLYLGFTSYATSGVFGTAGFGIRQDAATYSSTAIAGSPSIAVVNGFAAPTFTSTNAQAITNAATMYIAAAPIASTNVTIANSYALMIGSGNSYFGGSIVANNTIRLKAYTVATLPSGTAGDMAYVTDATSSTYAATVTGGGSIVTPVFNNGTSWVAK